MSSLTIIQLVYVPFTSIYLPRFKGIKVTFGGMVKEWKDYYDSVDPHTHAIPKQWDTKLGMFQKMIILRCLRPDKVRQL